MTLATKVKRLLVGFGMAIMFGYIFDSFQGLPWREQRTLAITYILWLCIILALIVIFGKSNSNGE